MKTLYRWLIRRLEGWFRFQAAACPASALEALEPRQLLSATVVGEIDDLGFAAPFDEDLAVVTDVFDDPDISGTVTRFDSVLGAVHVELFDQVTPLTVANFLNYVNDGDYNDPVTGDNFIHRSVPGFVVQGGGFNWDGTQSVNVPTDAPVVNEFQNLVDQLGPGVPVNTRGTVAMAKVGGNPDSATSQWFFNLADNSGNLDNQNGGFTTFGRVLFDDMDVVDQIAALPTIDEGGALTDVPVLDVNDGLTTGNLVRFTDIGLVGELSFEISNDRPDLVTVDIVDGVLRATGAGDVAGVANVTVTATDLLGNSVSESFTVQVAPGNTPPAAADDGGVGFATDADVAFTTASVLDNDTDADVDDVLAVKDLDTSGTLGLVTSNGDGTFDYDPDGQFQDLAEGETATDSFSYTLSDGNGGTDTAEVTVVVTGGNLAPAVADGQSFSIIEHSPNTTVVGTIAASDPEGGDLSYTIVGGTGSTAFAVDPETGEITVADADQLDAGVTPSLILAMEVADGNGGVTEAQVTIDLTPAATVMAELTQQLDEMRVELRTTLTPIERAGRMRFLMYRELLRADHLVQSTKLALSMNRADLAEAGVTRIQAYLDNLVSKQRLPEPEAATVGTLGDQATETIRLLASTGALDGSAPSRFPLLGRVHFLWAELFR